MTVRRRSSSLLVLAALLILGAVGCSHRIVLDRRRFDGEIAASDANASKIRVYVSKRLKVTYKIPRNGGVVVDTDIHLSGRRQLLHRIVGRNTRGKLIAVEQRAGRPLVHVAFDDRCSARRCAFAFVASEDGARFSLAEVPELPPATLAVSARDRGLTRGLRPGYLHHLGEPVQVYRAARRRRGLLTVDLEVIEHVPPRRVRFRIEDGARPERPETPPRRVIGRAEDQE
ncbi:hypothetical protein [Nannocystis sp. SCPEA4]|uniref:hypothetical protein n=1 Tax=Nannocystis sp. SCPEA4 TaxID=2996787 RepID=UPI00226DBB4B|nr:hypothetical protein [Nannocystis sp. SCPEA4]MCY1060207.1 hypothetical protein [Nannocystis sp. SCPEA4]